MKLDKKHLWRAVAASPLIVIIALFFTVPFNMGGCAVNDPTAVSNMFSAGVKATRAASLSEKDERDMGQSVAMAVTSHYGIYDDEKLNHYVTLVGTTVASSSPRSDLIFYFGVLDSDEVNAFSGPYGYVMITRGAVANCQNEAELAGLLGHEIGHIVKKHGLQAVQQAGFMDAGLTLAKTDDRVAQFGQMSDTIADVVLKKGFSPGQELEADHEGVKYVIAAGYNPDGYLHLLERLQAERGRGRQDVMSTHPGLDERIHRVADEIAQSGKGGQGAVLAERFAANVKLRP